jgi:PKD repeat protein
MTGAVCNATHVYTAAGNRTISTTVTDDDGGTATDSVGITVSQPSTNKPPKVDAGGNLTAMMGSTVQLRGRASDPERDRLTYRWSYAATGVTCTFTAAPTNLNTKISCTPGGLVKVTLTVSDGHNAPVSDSLTLTIRTRPACGNRTTDPATSANATSTTAGRRRRPTGL